MKPVVIFRHARCEGAGYLGTFLDHHAIPWCEVRIDLDEKLPDAIANYSGLVFMGGPMSVNDDLPWIAPSLQLIQEAVALDIPVLGHCLGGQLMSKALGGRVKANPIKEIGWGMVNVANCDEAQKWFGDMDTFLSFHWHGETFDLPEHATHLLASPYCQNQAWSMGKHLAMQCHVEMTEDMVSGWSKAWATEVEGAQDSPAVQTVAQIHENLSANILQLQQRANTVYSQWVKGLKA
jgi:GMP synthase-like glutamine amidotransferase